MCIELIWRVPQVKLIQCNSFDGYSIRYKVSGEGSIWSEICAINSIFEFLETFFEEYKLIFWMFYVCVSFATLLLSQEWWVS